MREKRILEIAGLQLLNVIKASNLMRFYIMMESNLQNAPCNLIEWMSAKNSVEKSCMSCFDIVFWACLIFSPSWFFAVAYFT